MKTAVAAADEKALTFPVWHTAALPGMIAVLMGLSILMPGAANSGVSHRLAGYFTTAAFEWAIAVWIIAGCRAQGESIYSLMGDSTAPWRSILRDSGLAVGFLVFANVLLSLMRYFAAATPNGALRNLLPNTPMEKASFLGLTVTAAFCEELIYRGYLQRQFTAWAGSLSIGVALQGIAFGAAHAYQGLGMVPVVAVYGCLFGLLAVWRRSLRPGMIAHLLQDAVGGLILARMVLK
jgi:membrane protease YdiL (CAAX protease family)